MSKRKRLPPVILPSRPTPEDRRNAPLLDAILTGEEALRELTGLELRTDWSWWEIEVRCPLCRLVRPHSWKTHRLLQPYTRRELDRERFVAVPRAERAWTQATGERIKMEALLARELRDRQPPAPFVPLAKTLGINPKTLANWGTVLGLPVRATLVYPGKQTDIKVAR